MVILHASPPAPHRLQEPGPLPEYTTSGSYDPKQRELS